MEPLDSNHLPPILYDKDIDFSPLKGKTIAMMGYGNQGRPQSLNLKDSGLSVIVGLRETSKYRAQALEEGFSVYSFEAAARRADVVMMMLPDELMASIYKNAIEKHLKTGAYLGFGHGLAIHAGWIQPDAKINVFLVAPKAQGRGVRNKFVMGSGIPTLYGVHQDPSGDTLNIALAYAKGIGGGRVGIMPTTFKEETECDLFSEQAVLCGGLTSLIKSAFETLVENGFSPTTAYFECLYEVKLIGDLLHEKGITGMRDAISSTALFGDLTRGDRVVDGHVKENMRTILSEITSGQFAQEMRQEFQGGRPTVLSRREEDYYHPIEAVHRYLKENLVQENSH
ncbi:MAG: ketol-acid reductoisomerase [Cyanobacteria bacterium]|nr:ketol-acid reductoisomerase [Cyanobacteriota bacterium]